MKKANLSKEWDAKPPAWCRQVAGLPNGNIYGYAIGPFFRGKNGPIYSGVQALSPRKSRSAVIINPDNPDLCRQIEQFLSDRNMQIENIPVTIIVNPPIRAVIENVGLLSEVLNELLTAYRSEGNYFLQLHHSPTGIVVTFGIDHAATSFTTQMGHC